MQSSNHPQSHTEQIQTTLPKKPLKRYKHGIAPGDTVRVLLGRGKHSDKITTAISVSFKEIVTPLGKFKPSALVKYIDRTAEIQALVIFHGTWVATSDGNMTKVVCTFAEGRVMLSTGDYYHYSQLTVVAPTTGKARSIISTSLIAGIVTVTLGILYLFWYILNINGRKANPCGLL